MKKIILVAILCVMSLCIYAQEKTSSDWSYYLDNLWRNFEENLYAHPETLQEFFTFYEEVKDNPFEVGTLKEDINDAFTINGFDGHNLYDNYGNLYILNELEDKDGIFINNVYAVAQILYDNVHNINFETSTYNALTALLTNSVNEIELYSQIAYYYYKGEKNVIHKLEFVNPFIKEEYKPILKYNGKEVEGILGERADISYTIDYNGAKDIPIRFANLSIEFRGNQWTTDDLRGEDKDMEADFPAILISENHYYLCPISWGAWTGNYVRHPGEKKRIRTFDTHYDSITSVEIISTDAFLDTYQVTWDPPAWAF